MIPLVIVIVAQSVFLIALVVRARRAGPSRASLNAEVVRLLEDNSRLEDEMWDAREASHTLQTKLERLECDYAISRAHDEFQTETTGQDITNRKHREMFQASLQEAAQRRGIVLPLPSPGRT